MAPCRPGPRRRCPRTRLAHLAHLAQQPVQVRVWVWEREWEWEWVGVWVWVWVWGRGLLPPPPLRCAGRHLPLLSARLPTQPPTPPTPDTIRRTCMFTQHLHSGQALVAAAAWLSM